MRRMMTTSAAVTVMHVCLVAVIRINIIITIGFDLLILSRIYLEHNIVGCLYIDYIICHRPLF